MQNEKPSVSEHFFSLPICGPVDRLLPQSERLYKYGFTEVCHISRYWFGGIEWNAWVAKGTSEELLLLKISEITANHHYYFHT